MPSQRRFALIRNLLTNLVKQDERGQCGWHPDVAAAFEDELLSSPYCQEKGFHVFNAYMSAFNLVISFQKIPRNAVHWLYVGL